MARKNRASETAQVFTPDQVVQLAKAQTNGMFHPYTCGNRDTETHRIAYGDLGALIPTVRGWICPFCDYRQTLTHPVMFVAGEIEMADTFPEFAKGD